MSPPAEFRDALDRLIGADPLTRAMADVVRQVVVDALDRRLPPLILTGGQAARLLNVSTSTVSAMVADGRLVRLDGVSGRITLASVLELAGWPVKPAPIADPLSVVPDAVAS